MNYNYFRKVNLDPHQDGNILGGLGLHNSVHGRSMDLGEFVLWMFWSQKAQLIAPGCRKS